MATRFIDWICVASFGLNCCAAAGVDPVKSEGTQPKLRFSREGRAQVLEAQELHARLEVGRLYVYRRETVTRVTIEPPQLPHVYEREESISQTTSFTVSAEGQDGRCEVELAFLALKQSSRLGANFTEFDSKQNPSKDAENVFAPAFRRIVGSKIHVRVSEERATAEVEDFDDWFQKVTHDLTPPAIEMVRQNYGKIALARLFDLEWETLPMGAVSLGAEWQSTRKDPFSDFVVRGTNHLERFEDHNGFACAVIRQTGALDGSAELKGGNIGSKKNLISGTMWFSPPIKAVVEEQLKQQGTMKIGVDDRRTTFDGKTLTADFTLNMSLSLVEFAEAGSSPVGK